MSAGVSGQRVNPVSSRLNSTASPASTGTRRTTMASYFTFMGVAVVIAFGYVFYLPMALTAFFVLIFLLGLGGGVIAVPALALAYAFFQVHFTATRATSLGMILPASLVGAFLHWKAGNVDLKLVGQMAPFALAFAVAGVLVAYAVPSDTLKVIFGVLLMIASTRLALQKVRKNN